ncbi:hypothetical protein K432DRAFT_447803 [Lepidopterella palustris CBS 459.81]|uniref:Apple domain-containing protein n=1 Tax=Lepidopterella palustris CBS 459.81 TaxID=1314670 RepID=A0A8E2DXR1_9PEZI|nr:hypothetical protein K432DRAFT_447803 [Lepidopterella palustris CBS 459.81]
MTSLFFIFISASCLANFAFAQSCPASNEQTFVDPSSQKTYRIECDVDRPGSDFPAPVWVNSLGDCIARCSSTSGCVNIAFASGSSPAPCYLKSGLNPTSTKTGTIGAHLLSAEGPQCPDVDNTCLNPTNLNEVCYQVGCGGAYSGTIVGQKTAISFQDCINYCESSVTSGSIYARFDPDVGSIKPGGQCHCQSSISSTIIAQSWGARRTSVMCPDHNGQNFTSSTGRKFLIECGIDRPGGDMYPTPAYTNGLEYCLQVCAQIPGCIDVAWHIGYPSGTCWFKNQTMGAKVDPEVMNAKWVPDCYSTTVTSTTIYTELTSQTPISYGPTPSPSTVPGGAQCYGWNGPGCSGNYKRAATPVPKPTPEPDESVRLMARDSSFCAPTQTVTHTVTTSTVTWITSPTTTCTIRSPASETTIPSYCNPTFAFNLVVPVPSLAANPENNIYTAPARTVINKIDCCSHCAQIFNCVWWYFEAFDYYAGDAWSPGTCFFAYRTNVTGNFEQIPAICPNGVSSDNSGWYEFAADQWGYPSNSINAYWWGGYNPGPCGGGLNLFESDRDSGLPPNDYDTRCPGQN